jgi:hypothetical protein
VTACEQIQNAGEISLRIKIVQFCRLNNGVTCRGAGSAAIRTQERKVLSCDSDSSQESLGQVVVYAKSPVFKVAR